MEFQYDSELLAEKFELIDHLSDNGLAYFQDFFDVETDLSESSMSVLINCDLNTIAAALESFCRNRRFYIAGFDEYTGRLTMFREGKSPKAASF